VLPGPARLALFLSATFLLCVAAASAAGADSTDWPNVGNDKGGTRYSALEQINRDNVGRLKVAWTWHTGDSSPGRTIECTPVVVDGVMYVTTVDTKVVALDAGTGKEIWRFDPYGADYPPPAGGRWIKASGGVNRGVAFWSDGKPAAAGGGGQRRVLLGAADGRLISLDAKTGIPDPAFAVKGVLDLRAGIERDISKMAYGPTSAPMVFEDLVIVGCSNDEGHPAAPGDPRAFDVRTGKEVWRFHTLPRPGEFAGDTWEPHAIENRGGANPWGGLTLDAKRGVLFMGTGSASPDYYGSGRKGNNLFANCTLALDARTGKRLWHFQSLHHDLWDHDLPCPPVVVTVKHDGKDVAAVAQLTKTGYCFLLDAATGEPLFAVRETPAPASDVPGEQASPTQPVPLKPPPLSKQTFTEEDATDISPEAHEFVLKKLKEYRHGGAYEPPSERGSVAVPGFHGGSTWAGGSFDPTTGYLYANTNNVPVVFAVKKRDDGSYQYAGLGYFNDAQGYPAIKPPWGQLTAIDLNTGEFAWRVTLGEYPELTAKAVPPTGTENFGGTIVTAGGLVFIGGTKDEKFHAFDKSTGKLLWDYQLPAGGYATPCTYMVNGKQYVVIAAGGGGKPRTKSGDAFVAFALP
jgi:quinoprotein glucose dehydrogenase